MLVYIAVGAGVVLLLWSALAFNALVTAHNRVNESWSGVDVQLSAGTTSFRISSRSSRASPRRSGRPCARHRNAGDRRELVRAPRPPGGRVRLGRGNRRRPRGRERYPELRASEAFRRVQAQLAEVEGEIQYGRRIYNSNVMLFNARVSGFPGLLVRRLGGFRKMGYFELTRSGAAGCRRPVPGRREAGRQSRRGVSAGLRARAGAGAPSGDHARNADSTRGSCLHEWSAVAASRTRS